MRLLTPMLPAILWSLVYAVSAADRCFPSAKNVFRQSEYKAARQTCTESCNDVGFCCTTGEAGCGYIPCNEGCHIAFFSSSLQECLSTCEYANSRDDGDFCWYRHERHADIVSAGFNPTGRAHACGTRESCGCPSDVAKWDCDVNACAEGCHIAEQLGGFYLGDDAAVHPDDLSYGSVPCGAAIPVFLIAGQSNAVGYPEVSGQRWSDRNGGAPGVSITSLSAIINNDTINDKLVALTNEQMKVDIPNITAAEIEAAALLDMETRHPGLFASFFEPLDSAYCAFTKADTQNYLSKPVNVNHEVCGRPYGPEFAFAHILSRERTDIPAMSIAKVAAGGKEIRHFMKSGGELWGALESQIQQVNSTHPACGVGLRANCKWAGIVWFQGENDSFVEADANSYEANLRQLMTDLRTTMQQSSTLYASSEDIPVVIVKLGGWVDSLEFGPTVKAAQEAYIAQDDKGFGVKTDDFDDFYQFNAGAFLAIGDRVAKVAETFLRDLSPTSFPTLMPSGLPSSAPSVSLMPSLQPSVRPSGVPSTVPSQGPSGVPSTVPTKTTFPSIKPSNTPSKSPTPAPSQNHSTSPSTSPSIVPSQEPSAPPSHSPRASPSSQPSKMPSKLQSSHPSHEPSFAPSSSPSFSPSRTPSLEPSELPTEPQLSKNQIGLPSETPSEIPSRPPNVFPSGAPSAIPLAIPSLEPLAIPSAYPTNNPSLTPVLPDNSPLSLPSADPSQFGKTKPSSRPSTAPSKAPVYLSGNSETSTPSWSPIYSPTNTPTMQPNNAPSFKPSVSSTPSPPTKNYPSGSPTNSQVDKLSSFPTKNPNGELPSTSPSNDVITSMPTTLATSRPSIGLHPTKNPTSNPTKDVESVDASSPICTHIFCPKKKECGWLFGWLFRFLRIQFFCFLF